MVYNEAHNVSLSKLEDFAPKPEHDPPHHDALPRAALFNQSSARPPTRWIHFFFLPLHPSTSLPLPFSLEIRRSASCGELISPARERYLKTPTLSSSSSSFRACDIREGKPRCPSRVPACTVRHFFRPSVRPSVCPERD